MDVEIIAALIAASGTILAEVLHFILNRKINSRSVQRGNSIIAVIIIIIAGLSAFLTMQTYMNKWPTAIQIKELNEKISVLNQTIQEKDLENGKLSTQNESLVVDNQSLKEENEKLTNQISSKKSLVKLMHKNERDCEISASPVTDTMGTVYSSESILLWMNNVDFGRVDFRLNRKYTKLSGITIAVSENSETSINKEYKGYVEISARDGDSFTPLYTSPKLSIMSDPVTVPEIDVTGIDWLEVRYYNDVEYWQTLQVIVTGGELI